MPRQPNLCLHTSLLPASTSTPTCVSWSVQARTKYHRPGDLHTTEIYFSQSQRLEVQDQGANKVGLYEGPFLGCR